MRRHPLLVTALSLAGLLASTAASATTNRMPMVHVDRDLVVPRHTIRIDGGPRWVLPDGQLHYVHLPDPVDDFLFLNAGATFGVIDDLHLGFVQPFRLTPDGDITNPTFHGLYQFTQGKVDVGIHWALTIPYEGNFSTRAGVPVYVHVSEQVRLDTGGFLLLDFPDDDAQGDIFAPFLVPINVTPQVFLGPESAIYSVGGFDDVNLLLGFFAGYTIETGGGTLGDLSGRFRFPAIDEDTDVFELIFAADLYFDL